MPANSSENTVIRNLTEGPVARQLFVYALPMIGANFLQALYTLVDLWVVGNFSSTAAISAVSISGQIVYLMHAVGMGIGNGGQIIISQQVGARDYKRLNNTIGTMLSFCTLSSIVIAAVGALGNGLWIGLMQTPEEAIPDALSYLLICCIGVPFVYVGGTLCAILRGVGNSRTPMYILGVSTVTNIILDFVFVGYFGWGATGAAWATVIAQFFSFVYGLIVIWRVHDAIGFDFKPKSFAIRGNILSVLMKLSTPLILMSCCITISMLIVTSLVNAVGLAESAITGIGSKLMQLVNVVTNSMTTAVGGMGAQNFAAGKIDRVRKINRISNLFCIAVAVVVSVILWLFPTAIIGIFTQPSDTEVLALAPTYIHLMTFTCIGSFLMATPNGHINAVGFTTLNLIIALTDAVAGRLGLAIVLGEFMGMGVIGYWLGNAIAPFVTVIIGFGYYFFGHWEKRRLLL